MIKLLLNVNLKSIVVALRINKQSKRINIISTLTNCGESKTIGGGSGGKKNLNL